MFENLDTMDYYLCSECGEIFGVEKEAKVGGCITLNCKSDLWIIKFEKMLSGYSDRQKEVV